MLTNLKEFSPAQIGAETNDFKFLRFKFFLLRPSPSLTIFLSEKSLWGKSLLRELFQSSLTKSVTNFKLRHHFCRLPAWFTPNSLTRTPTPCLLPARTPLFVERTWSGDSPWASTLWNSSSTFVCASMLTSWETLKKLFSVLLFLFHQVCWYFAGQEVVFNSVYKQNGNSKNWIQRFSIFKNRTKAMSSVFCLWLV